MTATLQEPRSTRAPRPPGSGQGRESAHSPSDDALSENGYQELLATVAAGQIPGGPAYDALIAFTAAEHNATLLSLDQRAAATYETVGAHVEQLLS